MADFGQGTGQEVFKLPSMSGAEVDDLLKSGRICRMALNDRPQPYIIPLDYVYVNGKIYFHFADYGKKMELFEKDPHVGVEIDRFNDGITRYESVTIMGTLSKVTDPGEKKAASEALINSVGIRGGEKNVAARHGYETMDEKTLMAPGSVVLRLDIKDFIALKSPA